LWSGKLNFKNLKIGVRLMILVGVLATLLVAVGAVGLSRLSQANDGMQTIYKDHFLPSHELDEINFMMVRNRLVISNTLIDPTPERVAKYTQEVEGNIAEIGKLWESYSKSSMSAENARVSALYAETRREFVQKGLRPTLAALRANELKEARRLVLESIGPLYDKTRPHLVALIEGNQKDALQEYEGSVASFKVSRDRSLAAMLIGLLFSGLLGFYLVRGITRPLAKAVQVAEDFTQGKLDSAIEVESADEVGHLMAALVKTQAALQAAAKAADFNERMRIALEGVDSNVMIADAGNNVIFMNRAVEGMLSRAESDIRKELPNFQTSKVLGSNIDIFHKNPAHQRDMLSKLRSTYHTQIKVGGRIFSLIATPVINGSGERLGTIVEWQDKTAETAAREAELKLMGENTRIKMALDSLPECVTISDADARFVHATPAAKTLLQVFGGAGFDADKYYGNKLSSLFSNPDTAARFDHAVTSGESVDVEMEGRQIRLLAKPIIDSTGNRLGRVTHWVDRTDEITSEKEVANIVEQAAHGNFSARLNTQGKTGFFANLSTGMNQLLETSEHGLTDVADVLAAFAEGDLTRRIERDYQTALFGKVKDSANSTAENLTRVMGKCVHAADALDRCSQPGQRHRAGLVASGQ
jgi:methyl-accepting chemotaxis protein